MKTLPFELKKALAGHKLVTRNGKTVSGFAARELVSPTSTAFKYLAYVDGSQYPETYTEKGKWDTIGTNNRDLFLLDESIAKDAIKSIAKDAIKPIPDGLPEIPDGYVFMGKGGEFEYNNEKTAYFFECEDSWEPNSDITTICFCSEATYYIFPQDSETVKINLEAKQKANNMKTFEEKLEEAKKFIGQTVEITDEKGFVFNNKLKVESVTVFVNGIVNVDISELSRREAERNGYSISLSDDKGHTNAPYNLCKVADEDIIINKYKANFDKVKGEGIVSFGCAEIDINYFSTLENMLNSSGNGNRKISGPFTIGRGVFKEEDIMKIAERIRKVKNSQ